MLLYGISGESTMEKIIEKKPTIKTAIETDLQDKDIQIMTESRSSELLKAIDYLQNVKNIESNTILTNKQVNALALMNWASQVYDIQFFKHYVALFPKYRISGDDGKGRKQIIQIAEAIQRDKDKDFERYQNIINRR